MKIRPPFKTHGGKAYLAQWIIEHFPADYEQYAYIEPYIGGGSVLLNKNPSKMEIINDLNLGTIQVYRALRDNPEKFIAALKKTRYCKKNFEQAKNTKTYKNYLEHAYNEIVTRRMSRGGLGEAFAFSDRLRGGEPGDIHAWKTIIKTFPDISNRLQQVKIFNKDAIEIIDAFNAADSLLYCDPPYLPDTRTATTAYKSYEMSIDSHIELAEHLSRFKGKVIISGYPSPLYNRLYKGWKVYQKEMPNHSSQKKVKDKRIETIWRNF